MKVKDDYAIFLQLERREEQQLTRSFRIRNGNKYTNNLAATGAVEIEALKIDKADVLGWSMAHSLLRNWH